MDVDVIKLSLIEDWVSWLGESVFVPPDKSIGQVCNHWASTFPNLPSYHSHWTDISIFGIINRFLVRAFFLLFWSLLIMTKITRKKLWPRSEWLCEKWKYLFNDGEMMEGCRMWKLNDCMNQPLVQVQLLVQPVLRPFCLQISLEICNALWTIET